MLEGLREACSGGLPVYDHARAASRGLLALLAACLLTVPAIAAECGIISWYGSESGNRTASGEYFNGQSLTAAHRTLPLGTYLKVTVGSRTETVRVNDRGPAAWTGASLDVSHAVAIRLGLIGPGRARGCWIIQRRGP